MKIFKFFFLVLLVGCSSAKVAYDYDKKVNFEELATFNFFEDTGKGLNEFDVKRIKNVIKAQLGNQGMKLVDKPAVFINFFSEEQEVHNRNTIGVGIGGGRNVGFGISGGIPISSKKIAQKFTIDFVESANNELIWQGIINAKLKDKMSPEEKIVHYNKMLVKIFEEYPPKKKTSN